MLAVQQQQQQHSLSDGTAMGYKHHHHHHHHGGGGGSGGGLATRKKMYITYNDANVPAKIALTKISRRTKVLVYGKMSVISRFNEICFFAMAD